MTGFVYAITNGRNAVKIGWAKEPLRRLAELNVASPDPLSLVGYASGGKQHERALQHLLRKHNIKGEWFYIEGPVKTLLALMAKGPQHPPRRPQDNCGKIKTVADVFDAFGGIGAVSQILGKNYSTCGAMKRRGAIPAWYFRDIVNAAEAIGLSEISHEMLVRLHSRAPEPAE